MRKVLLVGLVGIAGFLGSLSSAMSEGLPDFDAEWDRIGAFEQSFGITYQPRQTLDLELPDSFYTTTVTLYSDDPTVPIVAEGRFRVSARLDHVEMSQTISSTTRTVAIVRSEEFALSGGAVTVDQDTTAKRIRELDRLHEGKVRKRQQVPSPRYDLDTVEFTSISTR